MARRLFQIKMLPKAFIKAWGVICIASLFMGLFGMLHDFMVHRNHDGFTPLTNLGALGYFLQQAFPNKDGEQFDYNFSHVLKMAVLWAAMTTRWMPSRTDLDDAQIDEDRRKRRMQKVRR